MKTALSVAVCAVAGLAQSPAIIRVPVRVVTVPTVVVSTGGQFVRGLQPDNFSLFDNDRGQKLRVDYVDESLSLAIVVQTSASARAWLPEVRRAASAIEALVLGATGEASLSSFDDGLKLIQPLTDSSALLDKAFQSLSASTGNKSPCLDAVAGAVKQLEQISPTRRRVILLVAQSGDTGSTSNVRDVLTQLESNNIAVYSLLMPRVGRDLVQKTVSAGGATGGGITGSVDLGKLIPEIYREAKASGGQDDISVVTSETGGRQIPFRRLRDLELGIGSIGEELHTEYVLSYSPDRYEPGYHRIRVQVDRPGLSVRARPGYFVLQTEAP